MFHSLLALVPGRERFWTIPDCSCFTGIPKSYCFTGFATILYHIDCVSSCWPTDNAAMWPWFYFQSLAGLKLKAKTIVANFRSTQCQWRKDVRIEPYMACGPGYLPFQHVLLPFGVAGGLMSRACSYYLRVWREVAGGSDILSPRLSYYITDTLTVEIPNIASKICNIGSKMDFNDFGAWQKPLYKEATGRSKVNPSRHPQK